MNEILMYTRIITISMIAFSVYLFDLHWWERLAAIIVGLIALRDTQGPCETIIAMAGVVLIFAGVAR